MDEEDITKQVRQAEDAIIELAREKKKSCDISMNAVRLVTAAEDQINVLNSLSKSLESLSETISLTNEVSKTTINSIYKDASKSLNESTLRMEAIRDDFRMTEIKVIELDKVLKARSIDLQNQVSNLSNQITEVNKSIQANRKSTEDNRKWIVYSILAAVGAMVVASFGLLLKA